MENLIKDESIEYATNALNAFQDGDDIMGKEWLKRIPMDPSIALIIKEVSGVQSVKRWIEDGFDFSLVEEKYGKDWLAR